jgi:bifunctional oligoribonuclease and PAP phosphatase NrnA
VPVVNIDNHSTNDNFGQLNLVNLNASSVSEILAETLEKLNNFSIEGEIAECLLSGIMSATDSFQNKKTTPRALEIAARLMGKGANQQKIVRYLYKTQPFHLLKLWGRVMSRLKWDETLKLVWAPVLLEDFVQSRSNPNELPFILEKIKDNYSEGEIFLVFYGKADGVVSAVIKCDIPAELEKLTGIFGGQINQNILTFSLSGKSLEEAEAEIIGKFKTSLN